MRFGGRWVRGGLVAMACVAGAGSNASAQAPNRVNAVAAVALRPAASVFTPPAGLANRYTVALASRWNRPGAVAPCPVQGGETVEGELAWTGTIYEGMLRRTSHWTECGVHGHGCTVTVEGGAEVQAAGEVVREEGEWALSLRWTPARDVAVTVGGDCPPAYREAVERMYRRTTMRVTFPLPPANAFVQAELDPYPWAVRVE